MVCSAKQQIIHPLRQEHLPSSPHVNSGAANKWRLSSFECLNAMDRGKIRVLWRFGVSVAVIISNSSSSAISRPIQRRLRKFSNISHDPEHLI